MYMQSLKTAQSAISELKLWTEIKILGGDRMSKYWYVMHNNQGAVLENRYVDSVEDIKQALSEYQDPENISVRVEIEEVEVDHEWYVDNGFIEDGD
jgi:hypothetical protein